MPRNVRNFWLELSVDGSKSRVETGPRSKDGGFERDGEPTLIAEPGRDVLGPVEQGQGITIKRTR